MTKARIRQLRDAAGENVNMIECLAEIERLQSFTRRGRSPETNNEAELPLAAKVNLKKKARATVQELQAFAKEQDMLPGDGEFLFHHFEGKGWKDVKDWRAHFRKWKSAKWLPSQKTTLTNGVRPVRTQPAGCTL